MAERESGTISKARLETLADGVFAIVLPFSAALLGEHPRFRTPVILYAANMMAAGGSLALNWWYAIHRRRLVEPTLYQRVIHRVYQRLSFGPAASTSPLRPRT